MLLMGLMSVILFFGGMLTSNTHPVPIIDNLPNEGLLRPTSLLPWESIELSETRFGQLDGNAGGQEPAAPEPAHTAQPSGAPPWPPDIYGGFAHTHLCRTDSRWP